MGPFIFLDIESTGIDSRKDRIIEVAAIRWHDGVITQQFESLVNPFTPVPQEITLLTGITSEDVAQAPGFTDIRQELTTFIGTDPIVGHNIAFDTGFLRSHGIELPNKEIDTVSLARILLPREGSYALEVLMKKYGLPLRSSHRAMVDTQTTVDFFEFLLDVIESIPSSARPALAHIFEKTTWAGALAFEKMPETFYTRTRSYDIGAQAARAARSSAHSNALSQRPSLTEDGRAAFNPSTTKKILLESIALPPFEDLKNKRTILAYSSHRMGEELLARAESAHVSACFLKEPHLYLSPQRLAVLIEQNELTPEGAAFLTKIVIWEASTKTGERDELSLEREEYTRFERIADADGSDIHWKNALACATKNDVVLIHQNAFAQQLYLKIPDHAQRSLCIVEAGHLEESLTNAFTVRHSEASLRHAFHEKGIILYGLIGILYENHRNHDPLASDCLIVTPEIRTSREYKRIVEAAHNLPTTGNSAAHTKSLIESLTETEGRLVFLRSFADEITLTAVPAFLEGIFAKATAPFSHIVAMSPALSIDGSFVFMQKMLGLEIYSDSVSPELDLNDVPSWELLREPYPLPKIIIPPHLPDPNASGYFTACQKLFCSIIDQNPGGNLFLLNSKKAVESMHRALMTHAREKNAQLVSVGPSGGTGKSVALFLENPTTTTLMATAQVIPFLRELESHLTTVVFNKVPFDHPEDPIFKTRSARSMNSFMEYSVPRAALRFKELLIELAQSGPKTFYLLDTRFATKDYGKIFLQ